MTTRTTSTAMSLKLAFCFFMTAFSVCLYAQAREEADSEADHHAHHKNEIGVANSPVYFFKEEAFAYGLHIHYSRSLSELNFGAGLGYERIFDEHGHHMIGLEVFYRPVEALCLNLSPGLTFEDKNPKAGFSLHLETSYEFEIKDFHLGPALELAFDQEDIHLSAGLHLGYGF